MNTDSTRYIYREEPLSEAEAQRRRDEDIQHARDGINYLLADLRQAEQDLQELRGSPLETHITVQVTLNPGDPGYEDAPVRFNPYKYLGSMKWKTTANP